jgi:hypothetical protein
MTQTITDELLVREADGIEVSLVWRRDADTLAVVVNDGRLGTSFEVQARRANALDVFHHPYAYAAAQGVDFAVAA